MAAQPAPRRPLVTVNNLGATCWSMVPPPGLVAPAAPRPQSPRQPAWRAARPRSSSPRSTTKFEQPTLIARQVIFPETVWDVPYRAPPLLSREQQQREKTQQQLDAARELYEKKRSRSIAAANMATVSQDEFDFWFGVLCGKIKDRFMHVRRAFRLLDEDKSGQLGRDEFRTLLRMFNLECAPSRSHARCASPSAVNAPCHAPCTPQAAASRVRCRCAPEGVFDRLVHITDESGDGLIDYAEFARLATTDFKPANPANRWNPNRYLDRRTRGLG